MKKNRCCNDVKSLFYQNFRKMKLTLLFLFVTVLTGIAADSYSQSTKLTLKLENVRIEDVLSKIENQSQFRFFYNEEINLDKKVSIDVATETIANILEKIFTDKGIHYEIIGRQIILSNNTDSKNISAQQQKSISGKVTDTSGVPLPGVTVILKGTTQGIITDADGNYTLSNVPSDATLVFSFVGMKKKEVNVDGKTAINVTLIEETIGIEEVVAVGYGTQKKVNMTGSVSSISGKDILNRPVGQTSMALQGIAPGVTVTQNSGQPGNDGGTIRIRGIGTLTGSGNDPLVLVDGIESSLNSVSPNDIENISVLKDAASSAIYGSRAANGVILITTKRAESNKFNINYSNYSGWQEATRLPKKVSGYDHMTMINEANVNVGKPQPFPQQYIESYAKNAPSDDYPETDWYSEMLKKKAFQQNHHISVNGGGEKVNFLGSVRYLDQDGLSINTNYSKVSVRLNTDVKLKKSLGANFDVLFNHSDDAQPSAGQPWGFLIRYPNNLSGKNSDGSWGVGWDGINSWASEEDGGMKHTVVDGAVLNMKMNWEPFKGLNISAQYAPEIDYAHYKSFNKHVDLYFPDGEIINPTEFKASLTEKYTKSISNTYRVLTTYETQIKSHSFKILGGFEQIDYKTQWMQGYRDQYPLADYEVLNAGAPDNQEATGTATEWALRSVFGRINYDYSQKYLFEVNLRYDGSSRFLKDNKYGLFPSFSVGWRASEESFLDGLAWLSNLKLRTSWGRLGNQEIGNYPFASTISLGQNYVFNNATPAMGAALLNASNPEITWETTEMTNLGIDFSLFNKLNVTAEYYVKNTHDILLQLPIPQITGLNAPYQNAGKVTNKGYDFSVSYNDKVGKLQYGIIATLSDVKNKIVDLVGTGPYIESRTIRMEGSPIDAFYGYESLGLFQNLEEIQAHATQFGSVVPGDIKYKDQMTIDTNADGIPDSGDGKIDDKDRVVFGSPIPRYTFSFTFNAKYKQFDLSAFFQGVGKCDGYIDQYGVWAFYLGGTAQEWQKDYWTETNPNASYPRLTFNYPNNEQVSSYWKKSAAYLRLKNLQIGYTFPKSFISKCFLENARIYCSAQNLLTFDKFYKSFDPEAPIGTGSFYPMVKVFTFGIDLKL